MSGKWDEMRGHAGFVRLYNEETAGRTGRRPAAFVRSFGCQQNVADGERISGMLAEMGYEFTNGPEKADLVIYNTCAVRENAEDRIYGNAGALKHNKARNPSMITAVCGCMAQQKHAAEKIKKSYPHIDLVFGPSALPGLPKMLREKIETGKRVFTILDPTGEIADDLPVRRDGKFRAWLPVMYGCDNFCSYCVVPLVRGRERSRSAESVIAEARGLIEGGYKEITLLGQNVNSYKHGGTGFPKLLRAICAIPGEFRVRFTTSHPKDCSRELIDTVAECDKICRHLHLPFQSGSDRVLKAMNRGYTAQSYLDIIRYAKEKIPGVTFTSDVMVGFPGEDYLDVQKTIELIREVRFQSLFTFLYSKREGTAAAQMEDSVPDADKHAWFSEMLGIQNEISREFYVAAAGRTYTVLADGEARSGEGYITGRNSSNMIIDFKAPKELIGSFVRVKAVEALNWALAGELEQPCDR